MTINSQVKICRKANDIPSAIIVCIWSILICWASQTIYQTAPGRVFSTFFSRPVGAGELVSSDKPEAGSSEGIIVKAIVYGYNAEIAQTDANPLITASGQTVREGIVANNCWPFGQKVEIAGKSYEVQDRMAPRYDCNTFDIFFWDKREAIQWGKQEIEVKVLTTKK